MASTNAPGKMASEYSQIVFLPPANGSMTVDGLDMGSFTFLLLGVHFENKPESQVEILPIIQANVTRTEYHIKCATSP